MPSLHLLNRTLSNSQEIREPEDASHYDLFPQSAFCKCYFFDSLGKLSPNKAGNGSDRRFNDVLRHRFLIQGLVERLRASVWLQNKLYCSFKNAMRNSSLQLAALEQQKANDKMQKEELHSKIIQLDAKKSPELELGRLRGMSNVINT